MTDPWLVQNTRKHNETEASASAEESSVDLELAARQQQQQPTLEFEDNFAPTTTTTNNAQQQQQQTQQQQRRLDNNKATTNGVGSNSNEHQPLPDSASYLQALERKLQRVKKGAKLVDALAEKRQDCLRTLLQQDDTAPAAASSAASVANNNAIFELDAPINNGESTVQEIYRLLQPVRPVTVGETVHIVKYDHLEQQQQQEEEEEEDDESETEPESAESPVVDEPEAPASR